MKILTLDSHTDDLTRRSSQYRKEKVYDVYFTNHEVTNFDAVPPPSLRNLVSDAAKKEGVQFITGAGHGTESKAYLGNSLDILYEIDNYEKEEVSGKIVHLLSCSVGSELGPDMVSNGCRAFFGYSEDFSLLEDAADIFLECDSAIDIGLIQGHTAEEVFAQVQALFTQRIAELRRDKQNYAANWLLFNFNSLCAPTKDQKWGDRNARL